MPVTPSDPTPAELLALQALLDRSTRTATAAVADSVAYPARQMSAAEFVEFWRSVRLVAMATVGPVGQPHIAPVHAELAGTMLRLRIYEDTVRRQDLANNPSGWRREIVHAYFHDTDLLDRRRRVAVVGALRVLAVRCEVTDLPAIARAVPTAESVPWSAVARGGSEGARE